MIDRCIRSSIVIRLGWYIDYPDENYQTHHAANTILEDFGKEKRRTNIVVDTRFCNFVFYNAYTIGGPR